MMSLRTSQRNSKSPAKKDSKRHDSRPGTAGKRPPRLGDTLADQAYRQIKDRLIATTYAPGVFLQVNSICSHLNIGRTPVHQALHRLQSEGLLEIIPRKGVFVKADSLNEIIQTLEARSVIEPYCAAQCALKATPDDIARLREILDKYEVRLSSNDTAVLMQLDREFHHTISEIAGNPILAEVLSPIHERISRVWHLPHWRNHDFEMTREEHEVVYDAIARGDSKSAADIMRQHIESIRKRILLT